MMTIAEALDPAISGGAGWLGAGMLGAVLSWLMFVRLPAQDKLLKEVIADKDALVRHLLDRFESQFATQREMFFKILTKDKEPEP